MLAGFASGLERGHDRSGPQAVTKIMSCLSNWFSAHGVEGLLRGGLEAEDEWVNEAQARSKKPVRQQEKRFFCLTGAPNLSNQPADFLKQRCACVA